MSLRIKKVARKLTSFGVATQAGRKNSVQEGGEESEVQVTSVLDEVTISLMGVQGSKRTI